MGHGQGHKHVRHVLLRDGVQPAAQLRHVQRHSHGLHVQERKFPVRRQQAAHPLRVDGHLGLRLRWLWLELGSGDLRLRSDRLECCSSDFENSCCCTYYGEKRESGAALLPPTSLIAANKRDYLPDPCFLHTGGSTSPSRKPLCCDRSTESAPAIRYRSPWLHMCSWRGIDVCLAGSYGRGPTRGVVEGGRWTWVIGAGCVCLVGCGYTRD